jgi:ABC-type transport system involved in multi-copper enzyme maturation permease subunit
MENIKKSLRINPVLLKELKVKMRGWKAPILLLVYNGVLFLLTFIFFKLSLMENRGGLDPSVVFYAYAFLAAAQFGLITLISPALTAGAISGERERQTLDILLSTTLKHYSIVLGKLFASLSHIILLVVSSIPIFSIIFLFGGIGIFELLQTFLFYVVIAITLGSIGLFFSTFVKKSTAANVLSYAVIVFLCIGTLIITIFYSRYVMINQMNTTAAYKANDKTFWLMYFNPMVGFISLLTSQLGVNNGGGIFFGIGSAKNNIWYINIAINLAISVLLITACSIKLNPAKKSFSVRKKERVVVIQEE